MEETGKKRSKIVFLCIFMLLLAGLAVSWYYWKQAGEEDIQGGLVTPAPQNDSGVITASGATTEGMEREAFELKTTDAQLEIEEVYLSPGDEVEEGGKILKFTEDSLEEARRELEHAAAEAQFNYRKGAVDYQSAVIEAEEIYNKSLLEAEYAESVYENNLAQAREEIDTLEEELEDAKELYEEYYAGIYEKGYETEYEVAEKKALYETNEALYWDTLKKWNIDDLEINNSGGNSAEGPQDGMSSGSMGGKGGGGSSSDPWQITALEQLEDTYRSEREAYEQALEDCEKAIETAQAGIGQAKADYDLKALEVEKARIEYDKKAASYQADYETALAGGKVAQNTYQTEIKRQKETLDTLAGEEEETAENLEWFREYASDGYLHTQSRGTIIAVMVSEGTVLEEDTMILAYSNPDIVTVSASVGQSDIASLEVGEKAVVVTEEYGNFEGEITEINPVSNTGGRPSVTYTVEILLEGDVSQVEANRTVTVYFGIDMEEPEEQPGKQTEMDNGLRDGMQGEGMDQEDMPKGMPEMPDTQRNQPGGVS